MTGFTLEDLTSEHRDAFVAFTANLAPQLAELFDDSVEFAEGDHSLCVVAVDDDSRAILAILRVGGYELSDGVDVTCGIVDVLLDDDEEAREALLIILPDAARAKGFKHVITATNLDNAAGFDDAGWITTPDTIGLAWTGADDEGAIRVFELPAGSEHHISAILIDDDSHFLWRYTAAADRADQQARVNAVVDGLDLMQEAVNSFASGIEEFHIAY